MLISYLLIFQYSSKVNWNKPAHLIFIVTVFIYNVFSISIWFNSIWMRTLADDGAYAPKCISSKSCYNKYPVSWFISI